MPTVITRGAASAQGYGFAARSAAANYIEDVFSTYLYTGNGSTQTITNGIDLSTKGGMVWTKGRSAAQPNSVFDTVRGATNQLVTNSTAANNVAGSSLTAFTSTGFTLGAYGDVNSNGTTMASWTFRKQAKFFDVVTYTGDGVSGRTISHNLGSAPGCIIIKSTSTAGEYWSVYHRSLGATKYLWLQDTMAASTSSTYWNDTSPTSSVFSVGTDGSVNGNGKTYVAYLFAHDAGGFGATGSDNVISCGSYTGNGSAAGPTITLGYEPQWLLIKRATVDTGDWNIVDSMRGFAVSGSANDAFLYANTSDAESVLDRIYPTSTGFGLSTTSVNFNASGSTYIYIAIRRGPMKTPTTGTSVYNAVLRNGTQANATVTGAGFPVDLIYTSLRPAGTHNPVLSDRLRGAQKTLGSRGTQAEQSEPIAVTSFASMDGVSLGADNSGFWNGFNYEAGLSYVNWFFRRAPGFFDVVCYTGTGVARTVNHNLGVAPELMIVKNRISALDWQVYSSALANTEYLVLNTTAAKATATNRWNSTSPTSSVFSIGASATVNYGTENYVAYLFATVAGVSKVGSYTGTGTTNQINCGFTGGARFVLIKRTDSTGDWYVWDSARGIVAGNDSYLLLNSTAAEVTNTDYVDTYSAGFEISSTAPAAINANGGSFIFFAVA